MKDRDVWSKKGEKSAEAENVLLKIFNEASNSNIWHIKFLKNFCNLSRFIKYVLSAHSPHEWLVNHQMDSSRLVVWNKYD